MAMGYNHESCMRISRFTRKCIYNALFKAARCMVCFDEPSYPKVSSVMNHRIKSKMADLGWLIFL